MKIVINIDEAQKRMVDMIVDLPPQVENDLISAIRHGTPLPKGHGDLIDRQVVLTVIDAEAWQFCDYLISEGRNDEQKPVSHYSDNLRDRITNDLPAIIPAEEGVYECARNICARNEYNGIGCDKCVCRESPSIYPNSAEEVEE